MKKESVIRALGACFSIAIDIAYVTLLTFSRIPGGYIWFGASILGLLTLIICLALIDNTIKNILTLEMVVPFILCSALGPMLPAVVLVALSMGGRDSECLTSTTNAS